MSGTFKLKAGTIVRHSDERYMVIEIDGLDQVRCRSLTANKVTSLPRLELVPDDNQTLAEKKEKQITDLAAVPNEEWHEASKISELIRGLDKMGRYHRTASDIEEVAKEVERSPQTIYRWLKLYEKDGTIRAFYQKNESIKEMAEFI